MQVSCGDVISMKARNVFECQAMIPTYLYACIYYSIYYMLRYCRVRQYQVDANEVA